MNTWLSIIGMAEDGFDGLSAKAKKIICDAEVVVGTKRLLSMLPAIPAEIHPWPQPFSAVIKQINNFTGRKTVLLATGDPLNYGVARKILEFVPPEQVCILPALSSFSLAAAEMRWSLPDCDLVTLHGRPEASLEPYIQPGARLLVLTSDGTTIQQICSRLVRRAYGGSEVTVLENLGGPLQRVVRFLANEMKSEQFSDLNVVAVQCRPNREASLLSRIPGLPDETFEHDGQLTKREIRAVSLSSLMPVPDQLLWDVGAGCGSISIEWMRSMRGCKAIAFESDETRVKLIERNAEKLGTSRLKIVAGSAPKTFTGQPKPQAVFVGGGIIIPGLVEGAWDFLCPGGRIVANTVTLEGEQRLADLRDRFGGELIRIDVAPLVSLGKLHTFKPRMPVTQWRCVKQ